MIKESKKCSQCKVIKPFTQFYKDKQSRDGRNYTCKGCALTHAKRWQAKNYIRVLQNVSRYRHDNPVKISNKMAKRRANLLECENTLTNEEWLFILGEFNYKCVYCSAPWEHMDHFIPLSKGGTHTADNVVPACAPCNLTKSNKFPLDFINAK